MKKRFRVKGLLEPRMLDFWVRQLLPHSDCRPSTVHEGRVRKSVFRAAGQVQGLLLGRVPVQRPRLFDGRRQHCRSVDGRRNGAF